jgi:hypothetical protein
MFWLKATGTLADDPALHRYLLAYASDFAFLTTAMLPQPGGVSPHTALARARKSGVATGLAGTTLATTWSFTAHGVSSALSGFVAR